jgi:hypothetical protein
VDGPVGFAASPLDCWRGMREQFQQPTNTRIPASHRHGNGHIGRAKSYRTRNCHHQLEKSARAHLRCALALSLPTCSAPIRSWNKSRAYSLSPSRE